MVARMFESQLGKNVEAYIDDMVVMSKLVIEHLSDLGSVFEVLRKLKLRLNASKCSFGISSSIRNRYSTLAYPQGNEQAEAVNKVIVNVLKKRLDEAKGKWVDELPHVLWTYHTTPHYSTRETLFSMNYGSEAVIPLEARLSKSKTSLFDPDKNDRLLQGSLDLIDDRREVAMVQLAHYQQKLK
ncbi:uncharacterized protein LOC142625084 [Castanea sativa]|uniref:uncharacterized protein LOC142625084 n=1 Tax=Castanea sativa TaxID=21020 RepID=UPI003F652814